MILADLEAPGGHLRVFTNGTHAVDASTFLGDRSQIGNWKGPLGWHDEGSEDGEVFVVDWANFIPGRSNPFCYSVIMWKIGSQST